MTTRILVGSSIRRALSLTSGQAQRPSRKGRHRARPHPSLQQQAVREANTRFEVATEAWSPLGRGLYNPSVARAIITSLQTDIVTESGFTINDMLRFAGVMRNVQPRKNPLGLIRAFRERAELHPDDLAVDLHAARERAEPAIDAGNHVLGSHDLGVLRDPIGDQFRMFDEIRGRVDDAGNDNFSVRQLDVVPDLPLMTVSGIGARE